MERLYYIITFSIKIDLSSFNTPILINYTIEKNSKEMIWHNIETYDTKLKTKSTTKKHSPPRTKYTPSC